MASIVNHIRDVKGCISREKPKIRKLKKADYEPCISLQNEKPKLIVTRYGYIEAIPISVRVAEELIASGVSYGN